MPPAKRLKTNVDWSWVGFEAETASEITLEHRRRAAGLVGVQACKFDPYPPVEEVKNGEGSKPRWSAVSAAKAKVNLTCSAKLCKGKARCYNHLGANKNVGKDAKKNFIEQKMGDEPEHREKGVPAGLRNMGATCYANVYLQLWYHNIPFRTGLYSCDITPGSFLSHLVKVFAALEHSKRKVVDPSGLVEALELKADDQQDAGEFATLFMNVIEKELALQADPKLQTLAERLLSDAMSRMRSYQYTGSFLELELNLKNNETLQDRFRAFKAGEVLTGDNKYRCSACSELCEATRRIAIVELPPYLHFSLMRFTYDTKDEERKKSKAVIKYPKSATFAGKEYELCAVVLHLGSSPYHGHFVTELYDEQSKEWYTCSDESVTKRLPNALKKLGQPPGTNGESYESSKDAYMLVYKKKSDRPAAAGDQVGPPEVAMQAVREDNEKFEGEVREWTEKCELAAMEFETLKGIKEPVIAALSGDDVIIPRNELQRWLEGDMDALSAPIDYSSLACSHFTPESSLIPLDPTKMTDCRLISRAAVDGIRASTPCADAEICPLCVESRFTSRMSRSDREDQVRTFDSLNIIRVDGRGDEGEEEPYLLSKAWLDGWRRHSLSPPTAMPTNPGYSLYCGHDNPFPAGRTHVLITPSALALLHSAVGHFPAFTPSTPSCALCAKDSESDAEARILWLAEIKKDKAIKRELNPKNKIFGETYYILSTPWAQAFWVYQTDPTFPRPIYTPDLCPHGLLTIDPAEDEGLSFVTQKGWEALQERYGPQEAMTMVWADDAEEGKHWPWKQVRPGVCAGCRRERRLVWTETEIQVYLDQGEEEEGERAKERFNGGNGNASRNGDGTNVSRSNGSSNTVSAEREPQRISENAFKLNIRVAPPPTSSSTIPSKRSRLSRGSTTRRPKPFLFRAIPDSTVHSLRLAIYEEFQISPISQSIWYDGVELTDRDRTMREVGMVSFGEIRVKELKEEDEDAFFAKENGGRGGKKGGKEEGFGGTALTGYAGRAGSRVREDSASASASAHGSVSGSVKGSGSGAVSAKGSANGSGSGSGSTRGKDGEGIGAGVEEGKMEWAADWEDDTEKKDEKGKQGRACPDCTYINVYGAKGCEVCSRPFVLDDEEV